MPNGNGPVVSEDHVAQLNRMRQQMAMTGTQGFESLPDIRPGEPLIDAVARMSLSGAPRNIQDWILFQGEQAGLSPEQMTAAGQALSDRGQEMRGTPGGLVGDALTAWAGGPRTGPGSVQGSDFGDWANMAARTAAMMIGGHAAAGGFAGAGAGGGSATGSFAGNAAASPLSTIGLPAGVGPMAVPGGAGVILPGAGSAAALPASAGMASMPSASAISSVPSGGFFEGLLGNLQDFGGMQGGGMQGGLLGPQQPQQQNMALERLRMQQLMRQQEAEARRMQFVGLLGAF